MLYTYSYNIITQHVHTIDFHSLQLRHVQAKEAKTLEAKGKQERSVDGRERRTVTKYKSTMRTVDWISDKKSRHRSLLPGRDVLREGQSKVSYLEPVTMIGHELCRYRMKAFLLYNLGGIPLRCCV